ncbi:hypothetical protein [Cellulomonas aerilata]|uniref:Uncharacterized protein n=1 Tax=Cellulomonas aerilata TaxID=515326 RepID=A0A512DDX9_9CELL|nr:hypothetical protein [Cellulomonas aerilata]GEO34440.1 hypothetical protein CAE01nite_21650 [Cellulomonas aerilata]
MAGPARDRARAAARSDAPALPSTFATPAGAVDAARNAARRAGLPSQRGRRRTAEVQVPLGSLVTAPAPSAAQVARCGECAGTFLTRLAMTLTDGTPVTFVSCHQCEAKAWIAEDGAPLALDEVLTSATRS